MLIDFANIIQSIRYTWSLPKLLSLVQEKKYKEGLEYYYKILNFGVDNWRSRILAADCYYELGELEEFYKLINSSIKDIYYDNISKDSKSYLFITFGKKYRCENEYISKFYDEEGGVFIPKNSEIPLAIKQLAPLELL